MLFAFIFLAMKLKPSRILSPLPRSEAEFKRGTFRVKGDTVDIFLAYADYAVRFYFFGDEIEAIQSIEPATGRKISDEKRMTIFPANLFVTGKELLNMAIREIQDDMVLQVQKYEQERKFLEAKRLKERVEFRSEE